MKARLPCPYSRGPEVLMEQLQLPGVNLLI
ncbi:hypothetical protein HRbin08_00001 [bacterium HR08]|nr:hypothetical protein HRbin08_00001 [bacterium HR08]